MGADGFPVRQGYGSGIQVPGCLVQKEDVFAVVIDKGERAGRVQAPGSLDRGGWGKVLPFFHVRALEEGNGDGQQEKEDAENGYNDGKAPADDGFSHDAVKPQRGFCHLEAFRNGLGLLGRRGNVPRCKAGSPGSQTL